MLKEEYVSFETAKLLKENGFPQDTFSTNCNTCYKYNGIDKVVEGGAFGTYEEAVEAALKYCKRHWSIV